MRIKFTQHHKVQQGDGKGPKYEAGREYDFVGAAAETYARKYIARGIAEEVDDKAAVRMSRAAAAKQKEDDDAKERERLKKEADAAAEKERAEKDAAAAKAPGLQLMSAGGVAAGGSSAR